MKVNVKWLMIIVWIMMSFLFLQQALALTPAGYEVSDNLRIGAVIHTVEKGEIEAIWHEGGRSTTTAGDTVIWGYFYADPNDVTWGNKDNPELNVKIWYDHSGRIDVNFFHVSVPDISVYSDYLNDGNYDNQGTTTLFHRYIRQDYNKETLNVSGPWVGTHASEKDGESGYALVVLTQDGNSVSGYDWEGNEISGSITGNHLHFTIFEEDGYSEVDGQVNGNVCSGTWEWYEDGKKEDWGTFEIFGM